VEAPAATALPSIGGRAAASECSYVLDGGFVRFEAAGSEVVGEELPSEKEVTVFKTRSTAWIRRLRIAGLLEIGDLSVTLESRYDMRGHEPPHETVFLGLTIERDGLTVCGQAWTAGESPALAWINGLPTYELAQRAFVQERANLASKKAGSERGRVLDQVYGGGRRDNGPHELVPMSDPGALRAPDAISVFGLEPPALKGKLALSSPRRGSTDKGVTVEPAVGGFNLKWSGRHRPFLLRKYVVTKGYRRFAVRMVMTRSPEAARDGRSGPQRLKVLILP
jgi:hypothetical protein